MTQRVSPLVGNPINGGNLTTNLVNSSKPALARFIGTVAGNNRMLYEHATGREVLDASSLNNQTAIAPLNARGILGEDHSGAPFGKALEHSFFTMSFPDMSETGLKFSGASGTSLRVAPGIQRAVLSPDVMSVGFDFFVSVPVPACWPGGAYETCNVSATVYVKTATAAGTTCELDVYPEGATDTDVEAISFSTTSVAFVKGSVNIDVTPGNINRIRLRMSTQDNSVMVAYLQSLAFSQIT